MGVSILENTRQIVQHSHYVMVPSIIHLGTNESGWVFAILSYALVPRLYRMLSYYQKNKLHSSNESTVASRLRIEFTPSEMVKIVIVGSLV